MQSPSNLYISPYPVCYIDIKIIDIINMQVLTSIAYVLTGSIRRYSHFLSAAILAFLDGQQKSTGEHMPSLKNILSWILLNPAAFLLMHMCISLRVC